MFLIRTAFWLSLVVLLLPNDPQQQAKLYQAASNAVTHAATFCDRNAQTCAQGAAAWASFKTKLEFGSRLAIDLATEQMSGKPAAVAPVADTLEPADRAPAWRNPRGRTGA